MPAARPRAIVLPAAILLAVMLAAAALFLRGDRGRRRRFRGLTDTGDRQRGYRRWAARLWLFLALPAIAGLALLGRLGAIAALPAELSPLARRLPRIGAAPGELLAGIAAGIAAGVAVVAIVMWRRGGRAPRPVGDTAAILPRTRAELAPVAWLALTAGVAEELAFRLYLPLLIALVTGSAAAGVVLATVLFGAMHAYQGPAGIVAAIAIGAVLAACYLASGALWVAILLHAAIDLSALVLRPLLAGAWRR